MSEKLTKEEFLARCANAYDCGLVTKDLMHLLNQWLDTMMRLEHSIFTYSGQSHFHYVWDFLQAEQKRLGIEKNGYVRTLAGDKDGYNLIQFAAILCHHCQECATDPHAWWTRSAFCEHKGFLSCCNSGEKDVAAVDSDTGTVDDGIPTSN
jgi:hypothetical protein